MEKGYSKNFLRCPECKGIPKILFKNRDKLVLTCIDCYLREEISISNITELSTKWIEKVFFKCNYHKEQLAIKYCKNCDLFLCSENEIIHNEKKENHDLDFIYNLDINICEKHSKKLFKYCATCDNDLCSECINLGHKNHQIKIS